MYYFNNFKLDVYEKFVSKDEFNQVIEDYRFPYSINCDIQPSSQKIVKEAFGRDIESLFTVFSSVDLELDTVVKYNEKVYKVNGKVDWIDYKVYSIVGSDVVVN